MLSSADAGLPYGIELAVTKEYLIRRGVRYAIGAVHWRVDIPNARRFDNDLDACIKEFYRQQMYLACDERVTILGHPWYHGDTIWYGDFSLIPRSMNLDIAAALKENGKYVECNSHFFYVPQASEKFRRQYAEFLRELFYMGIPVTHGSDAHSGYNGFIYLETATWYYPAISIYRKFGFSEYRGEKSLSSKMTDAEFKAKNEEAIALVDKKLKEYSTK